MKFSRTYCLPGISKKIFQTHQIEVILDAFFLEKSIIKVISEKSGDLKPIIKTYKFNIVTHHMISILIKYSHGIFEINIITTLNTNKNICQNLL